MKQMVKFKKEFLTDPNLVIECKEPYQRDNFVEWCKKKGIEVKQGNIHYSCFRVVDKELRYADKKDYEPCYGFIIIPYNKAIKKKKTPADKLRKLLSKIDTSEVQEILKEYKDKTSDDISKTFLWIENWLIRNDDGWRPDWNDNTQAKYYICYNNRDNRWGTDYCAAYNCNQIVMSKENADKLLEILNKQ